jgi:hypothetical protein
MKLHKMLLNVGMYETQFSLVAYCIHDAESPDLCPILYYLLKATDPFKTGHDSFFLDDNMTPYGDGEIHI